MESPEAICRRGKPTKRWFANGFFKQEKYGDEGLREQGHIIIQP